MRRTTGTQANLLSLITQAAWRVSAGPSSPQEEIGDAASQPLTGVILLAAVTLETVSRRRLVA
jgi:hypothetical protein